MKNITSDSVNFGTIAFIGGGNMASAMISGLLKRGMAASSIQVVEPLEAQRVRLGEQFNVLSQPQLDDSLVDATVVVWAIKPQTFKSAAVHAHLYTKAALHLSVAAGIGSGSIARWLGADRVVRGMPNTPALIGKGITALFARPAVTLADKVLIDAVVGTTGDYLWLDDESQLDAVTALSGSGPAYVFYFIEAMIEAGAAMGLSHEQARKLAVGTFTGASVLANMSSESLSVLRARVTSKGGTTHAAITAMEQDNVKALFVGAMHAAKQRARELGDEFGS